MPGKRETKNYTPEMADVEGLIRDPYTFYCVNCSEFAVILTDPLEKLPRRKTDNAFVVTNDEEVMYRNNMLEGDCKLLKREGGAERQYRWLCRGCKLVLAYRSGDFKDAAHRALYLKDGALTRNSSLNLVALADVAASVPDCIATTSLGVQVTLHLSMGANVPCAVVDILNDAVLLQLKSSIKKEIIHRLLERFLASLLEVSETLVGVTMLKETDRPKPEGGAVPGDNSDKERLLERAVVIRADVTPRFVLEKLVQSFTNTGRLQVVSSSNAS
eukprot:GGOE01018151.1.p1 GENE.GGOE01018151.1~~GGOE01018151.1.p1  ORF type:complete len:273 (-),score=88.73 GGOE01018151.1:223-1041(-)